jgi:hypothetical protein
VKLLNNDDRNYNFPSTSSQSQSQSHSRRPPIRALSHKRYSLNNEVSTDADQIDVSFAFPHDFENMKRYTDDIWQKTVSSDCDQSIQVWEKQPEANNKPNWSTSSSLLYMPPRSVSCYDNDVWTSMAGGNIFFPAAGPSTSSRRPPISDTRSRAKKSSATKPQDVMDSDDEFNTIKKRLSLSSLRSSLCRQKALENGNAAHSSAFSIDSNDDFLQVFIIFLPF